QGSIPPPPPIPPPPRMLRTAHLGFWRGCRCCARPTAPPCGTSRVRRCTRMMGERRTASTHATTRIGGGGERTGWGIRLRGERPGGALCTSASPRGCTRISAEQKTMSKREHVTTWQVYCPSWREQDKWLCRKCCSGGHEGAVALVCGGITRPGHRTVQPQ